MPISRLINPVSRLLLLQLKINVIFSPVPDNTVSTIGSDIFSFFKAVNVLISSLSANVPLPNAPRVKTNLCPFTA